jgi:hypothetical protein
MLWELDLVVKESAVKRYWENYSLKVDPHSKLFPIGPNFIQNGIPFCKRLSPFCRFLLLMEISQKSLKKNSSLLLFSQF